MFDIGWSEMVVVGVVALVVIGPKELPGVIRSVGKAVGKLRTMAGEFRTQFDDAMREADLHDVKKTFTDAAEAATSAASAVTNPLPITTGRDEASDALYFADAGVESGGTILLGDLANDSKRIQLEFTLQPEITERSFADGARQQHERRALGQGLYQLPGVERREGAVAELAAHEGVEGRPPVRGRQHLILEQGSRLVLLRRDWRRRGGGGEEHSGGQHGHRT